MKELYRKYTRTRSQRAVAASILTTLAILILFGAISIRLLLFFLFCGVLPIVIIFGVIFIVAEWIDKGERF